MLAAAVQGCLSLYITIAFLPLKTQNWRVRLLRLVTLLGTVLLVANEDSARLIQESWDFFSFSGTP